MAAICICQPPFKGVRAHHRAGACSNKKKLKSEA